MALRLYSHPLASYCHKVLIALYESGTPFENRFVDFADEKTSQELHALWPVGLIPLLLDGERTVPETSIQIEYLDRRYPGPKRLIPAEAEAQLDARLWDRFYDSYVMLPMQKIVADRLRPENSRDPFGVQEARDTLKTSYGMLEARMKERAWAIGDDFTIADCAAAPSLFYAGTLEPFGAHPSLTAYFERLLARPSFARVLEEAKPYFKFYPYVDDLPARFK